MWWYYITSHSDKPADFIAYAIRSHWHIETKLHWQLESVLVKTDSA
ncbi:hypothetical protein [Xenorhabdus bovienii]